MAVASLVAARIAEASYFTTSMQALKTGTLVGGGIILAIQQHIKTQQGY